MTAPSPDLSAYCLQLGRQARSASRVLATARTALKNHWLRQAADALEQRTPEILTANGRDLADASGLSPAQIDRLRLTPDRIRAAAAGLREVADLSDPIGQVRESRVRPNGLEIHKVGVPLGVILFIYESRPNVTVDAAALCVKSGNALILRGGREALHSNTALHRVLQECLESCDLPGDAVQLVTTPERDAVGQLLRLNELIDLVIPRGGEGLIRRVAAEARMPVLKHYKGNCHVYLEKSADPVQAERIVLNSKCQRPGVCNAAESVLIDAALAESFLPRLAWALQQRKVEIRGCPTTCRLVPGAKPATEEDFAAEFLDLIVSIKVVTGLEEAIAHISRHGSQHTETIVTTDLNAARRFTAAVDSSCVLVNASTRFNDGFELGLGAEIGISTDKFHARGPCGLLELTSYKYIVYGEGQVRGE
jgi:glutamate-5-semialdehyde dehydrogenase